MRGPNSAAVTSPATASASPPAAFNPSAAARAGSSSMSDSTTRPPCAANSSAHARPMPRAAPVMMATLPSSSCISRETNIHMDGQAVQDKAISNLRFQILNPVHPVHPCELFLCLFFLAQDAVEDFADGRLGEALAYLDLRRDFELGEA